MTRSRDGSIEVQRALLLRVEDAMGVVFQAVREDVSDVLGAGQPTGVDSSLASEEDRCEHDELLLLFPAQETLGTTGQLGLVLIPEEPGPAEKAGLRVKKASLSTEKGQTAVRLLMEGTGTVRTRWVYGRRPEEQHVLLPAFDDPERLSEGQRFDVTEIPTPTLQVVSVPNEWSVVNVPLTESDQEKALAIDHCERLLEALDVAIGNGRQLHWHRARITVPAIERIAKKLEEELADAGRPCAFGIVLEIGGSEDLVIGKRLRPVLDKLGIVEDGERTLTLRVRISLSRR